MDGSHFQISYYTAKSVQTCDLFVEPWMKWYDSHLAVSLNIFCFIKERAMEIEKKLSELGYRLPNPPVHAAN
jgi:hypothetical protein